MTNPEGIVLLWVTALGIDSPVHRLVAKYHAEMNEKDEYFHDGTLEEFAETYRQTIREDIWELYRGGNLDYTEPGTYLGVMAVQALVLECDWALVIRRIARELDLKFLGGEDE